MLKLGSLQCIHTNPGPLKLGHSASSFWSQDPSTVDQMAVLEVLWKCFGKNNQRGIYPSDKPGTVIERSNDIGHAIGVVRVVVQTANMKRKRFARTPRPFIRIGVRGGPKFDQRTSFLRQRTSSPNWISETTDLIVYSLDDMLEFQVMNDHMVFKPNLIGIATFSLGIFAIERTLVGVERIIRDVDTATIDSKGTLLFDVFYFPVILAGLSSPTQFQTIAMLPGAGVVTLKIQSLKDFIWGDHLPNPDRMQVSVSLGWTDNPIHTTRPYDLTNTKKGACPPTWNSAFDYVCFNKSQTTVVIKITDCASSYFSNKTRIIYGHVSVALDDLLIAQDEKLWPLSGCPHGVLNMSAHWRPIADKT